MRSVFVVVLVVVASLCLVAPPKSFAQSPAVRPGLQRFASNHDTPYTTNPDVAPGLQRTGSNTVYCVYDYDFNSGPDGWTTHDVSGRGDFAALLDIAGIVDQDPTPPSNLQDVWTFFSGSTANYACGGWPAQQSIEKSDVFDRYVHNEVRSKTIDWLNDCSSTLIPGAPTAAYLEFDVYEDLPLDNLVFYYWRVRWLDNTMTPIASSWTDVNGWYPDFDGTDPAINATVFYGDTKTWQRHKAAIGTWTPAGANYIEVALGTWDLCELWCGFHGTGACHSHAPLFDNVKITRVDPPALWTVNDAHLFQDNFSWDGTTTGTVRIDMAYDTSPPGSNAVPGDSTVVMVTEPINGIGVDPTYGGAAVYIHVKELPGKSGAPISGDPSRWPFVSSSGGWTTLRMDQVYMDAALTVPVPDRYCADLDDDLYTPGDTVCFYFSATDGSMQASYWTQFIGVTTSEDEAKANCMEMTCLPANTQNGGDILYVDAYDGGGAQPYFDWTFHVSDISDKVDRYDMRGTGQIVNNGLSTRVKNVANQLVAPYRKIVWNSGDLTTGNIPDGTGLFKCDDYATLYDFVDNLPVRGGLYLGGDNLATEFAASPSTNAAALRSAYINFTLVNGDHRDVGEPITPMVIGQVSSLSTFYHVDGPDTLLAYGGGDIPNDFDVLLPAGSSEVEMAYSDNVAHGAVLSQSTENSVGDTSVVFLAGFSYHFIRDDRPLGYDKDLMDRFRYLHYVLLSLNNVIPQTLSANGVSSPNQLAQCYPNPFNPSTTIEYRVGDPGLVSLRIYDAAGRLVRTLVSGAVEPARGHTATWDGTNDQGASVASGVYFYRLVAGDYSATKKMVMIK